ncbi:hypothetical protein [Seohaeicola zhoushanensis]|uniref:hypothetical protein n=1 Tax=Seohaeicola zhoushanensis TaxID=1569283 RepID=UPI00167A9673|nr:hypothetical protein [Seohaeicola zhoushanensis]
MFSHVFRALLIGSLLLPSNVLAYGEGGGYGAPRNAGTAYGTPSGAQANAATTNAVVKLLTGGVRGCQRLQKVYRYDCYSQVYGQAAGLLRGNPAYSEARVVLSDVERSLSRTVRRNLDRAQPQVRMGNQQFRAIRADTLPAAKAAFASALEEAETRLLRSSNGQSEHHIRIAAALNSNKVLLRSALLLLRLIA